MSKQKRKQELDSQKDHVKRIFMGMNLQELSELDSMPILRKFFDGKRAFNKIDDTYTRKRLFNEVYEYKKQQKRFDDAVNNKTLWKLLFPYLNIHYEQEQEPQHIMVIACVGKNFRQAGATLQKKLVEYKTRMNNSVANCALWQALYPYIHDDPIPKICDVVNISFISRAFFYGLAPVYEKACNYQRRLNNLIGNHTLWEVFISNAKELQTNSAVSLAMTCKPLYELFKAKFNIYLQKAQKRLCLKCKTRNFVLYEVNVKIGSHCLCADCDETNKFNIVHGYSPDNYLEQTYIDCANNKCKCQFFLRRDYKGNWPKCPKCRGL